MAIGLSIHIGLNEVDTSHYGGSFPLRSCVADAHAMRDLAVEAGFEPLPMLLGRQATAEAVLDAVRGAAPRIGGDGILLLTYAGHGGQVRDVCGERHEGYWDETWCTYNRQLIDDELRDCWPEFAPGARVLVVSDSCFSGDVIRLGPGETRDPSARARWRRPWNAQPVTGPGGAADRDTGAAPADVTELPKARVTRGGQPAVRALSPRVSRLVYRRHKQTYDGIQQALCPRLDRPIAAQVLLLAASEDHEHAREGAQHGVFTEALLHTWDCGKFQGSYRTLHDKIRKRVATQRQHPTILAIQPPAFAEQRPFTI